eukprot:6041443-Pyramimonas_sp.AAC.1
MMSLSSWKMRATWGLLSLVPVRGASAIEAAALFAPSPRSLGKMMSSGSMPSSSEGRRPVWHWRMMPKPKRGCPLEAR